MCINVRKEGICVSLHCDLPCTTWAGMVHSRRLLQLHHAPCAGSIAKRCPSWCRLALMPSSPLAVLQLLFFFMERMAWRDTHRLLDWGTPG
mmetsp:Transcript_52852/g.115327  ORF Transcript_52852/g.115327 Transcript_52852/m.115327 type:complete len:91 (+) Transcript_52852:346-618(+)